MRIFSDSRDTNRSFFIAAKENPIEETFTAANQPTSTVSPRLSPGHPMFRTSCSFTPCENGGNCTDDSTFLGPFTCQCPANTRGDVCQHNDEPCEPDPCANGGSCIGTSKDDFYCRCHRNWTGRFCEIKVNFCPEKTCYNRGQCRPLLGYAICECLPGSFTGDQCEITLKKVSLLRIISKSFAYVAIVALCSVALFVIVMDILKYFFGIDPVAEDREQLRQEKRRRRPKIEHFVYVNRPEELGRVRQGQTSV